MCTHAHTASLAFALMLSACRPQRVDLVKAGQWLAEHLGLPVVLLSAGLCQSLGGSTSAAAAPASTSSPSFSQNASNNASSARAAPAAGPSTACPAPTPSPALGLAAAASDDLPVSGAAESSGSNRSGAPTVPPEHWKSAAASPMAVAAAPPGDRDKCPTDISSAGPSAPVAPATDSAPAHSATAAPAKALPGTGLLASVTDEGDDFLDDLLSAEPVAVGPPALSAAPPTAGGTLPVPLMHTTPAALPPPKVSVAAHADAGDDFLDDLLSDEPAAAVPKAKLAAAESTAQGVPRRANPPADCYTSESSDADFANCKRPSAAAASATSGGRAAKAGQRSGRGDASELLDALMADDIARREVMFSNPSCSMLLPVAATTDACLITMQRIPGTGAGHRPLPEGCGNLCSFIS